MKISIAPPCALCELGERSNQEDSLWPPLGEATVADRLFVVCDGMGGHEHGEVASRLVAETMGRYGESHPMPTDGDVDGWLKDALNEAYNQLDLHDNPADTRKMGTTLTLVCFHRRGCTMAHIGDSRIYHIRPSENRLLYQSRDHSLVMDLYLSGELKREEMNTYSGRNVITRCMQPAQERRSKADVVHTTDICAGDYFLLCSDGVLEQLAEEQLLALLGSNASDESKCRQLVEATSENADNHTAYLIRIAEVEPEDGDADAPNDEKTSRANLAVMEQMLYTEKPKMKWWQTLTKKFRSWGQAV